MSSKLFLLLNHDLTSEQRLQAANALDIADFVMMPEPLRQVWSNISPHADKIAPIIAPIIKWLAEHALPKDYVLVQGDPGACYLIANYCYINNLIPIYATTERTVAEERLDGEYVTAVRQFRHCIFRRYGE